MLVCEFPHNVCKLMGEAKNCLSCFCLGFPGLKYTHTHVAQLPSVGEWARCALDMLNSQCKSRLINSVGIAQILFSYLKNISGVEGLLCLLVPPRDQDFTHTSFQIFSGKIIVQTGSWISNWDQAEHGVKISQAFFS